MEAFGGRAKDGWGRTWLSDTERKRGETRLETSSDERKVRGRAGSSLSSLAAVMDADGVGARGRPYALGDSGDGGSAADGFSRKYSRWRSKEPSSVWTESEESITKRRKRIEEEEE